jgi:UDP-N-acetyl-D-mannosaminuronate dehydrogenase
MLDSTVVIAGMGEVGRPLGQILSRAFDCIAVDIEPVEIAKSCDVLHICYPFQIAHFVETTVDYTHKYEPTLTVINSTVAPGTTRAIQARLGTRLLAYSPVRGKHAHMEAEMLYYRKFISACTPRALEYAVSHFLAAGFHTDTFRTPEIAELSKLLETTYFGTLIAWAQEVERFAARYNATFDDVNAFVKEVDFLPSHIFPGHIGGHCVMPNILILQEHFRSLLLDAIVVSNATKRETMYAVTGGGAND